MKLQNIFDQIKNSLYKKDFQPYDMKEIFMFLDNPKDKKKLDDLSKYIIILKDSIAKLGVNFFNIDNDKIDNGENFILSDDLYCKIPDIIQVIDLYVDTLGLLLKLFSFDNLNYAVFKLNIYLKTVRGYMIKKVNEYQKQLIKNERDWENIKLLLNDVIDIFTRESKNLQIIPLYNKVEEIKNHD